jgi:hypothetical protein
LLPETNALPPFDFHAPLISLPAILKTTLNTIPRDVPYLFPDPNLVEQWRRRLHDIEGVKIGIAWEGDRRHEHNVRRSIPLQSFVVLGRLPGVTLISLQKGPAAQQVERLDKTCRLIDWKNEVDGLSGPFMDTAALMKSLDLIITCDTSIAHLAGALAAPVWVALPYAADWRWLMGREDSPWYPTMRLFRQSAWDDWKSAFDRIATALAQRLNTGPNA